MTPVNGSAGEEMEWHHIVEQCQANRSGFSSGLINNSETITAVSREIHQKITGYYNSKPSFTNGLIFRDYISGKSFPEQYAYGIIVIKAYSEKN